MKNKISLIRQFYNDSHLGLRYYFVDLSVPERSRYLNGLNLFGVRHNAEVYTNNFKLEFIYG